MATKTILIQIKADPDFAAALDDWRRKQSPIPSRSAAIRFLVGEGIKTEKKAKKA